MRSVASGALTAISLVALALCFGCHEPEAIVRYQVPKDRSGLEGIRPAKGIPAGWIPGATNSMVPIRLNKTYDTEQAEITVIPLPGDANDWESNAARWSSDQLLLSLDADAMAKLTTTVKVDGVDGKRIRLVDKSAADGKAIIGLMVNKEDTAWFIKLMGPLRAVEKAETDFDQFVSEFEFPTRIRAGDSLPPRAAQQPAAQEAEPPAVESELLAGWMQGKTNSMVPIRIKKRFGEQAAEISVIPLPAAVNDWDSNVERWASQQLGLNLDEKKLAERTTTVTVDEQTGKRIRLVESTGNGKAIIGLMIVNADTAWFIKLMGPLDAVEKAESDFDEFVTNFKFPN